MPRGLEGSAAMTACAAVVSHSTQSTRLILSQPKMSWKAFHSVQGALTRCYFRRLELGNILAAHNGGVLAKVDFNFFPFSTCQYRLLSLLWHLTTYYVLEAHSLIQSSKEMQICSSNHGRRPELNDDLSKSLPRSMDSETNESDTSSN